jgi:EAL domain-containing protein (putative c-di-GMP-specific phosphodiesterase class I)
MGLDLKAAVNVSVEEFRRQPRPGSFREHLYETLAAYSLSPSSIELEVTESVLANDEACKGLAELAREGFSLAIDDFGREYSVIGLLEQLHAHRIKIDKLFVDPVASGGRRALLVQKMIEMGHCMELEVTAEGVESPDQVAALRGMGCDEIQGYVFSRPLPPSVLPSFLAMAHAERAELAPDNSLGSPSLPFAAAS